MNDLEINSIAGGMFLYLKQQSPDPIDGLAILGTIALLVFDNSNRDMTIEAFADNFKSSLIESWKSRSMEGSGRVQ